MKTFQRHGWATRYFLVSLKVKNWFVQLPFWFLPAHIRLSYIATGYGDSRLLYLAAKLGVADQIAEQSVSIEMLSKQLIVDSEALYRLLRSLASLGVFNETHPQVFVNTRLSELLRSDNSNTFLDKVLEGNSIQKSGLWLDELELKFARNDSQNLSLVAQIESSKSIKPGIETANRVASAVNPYCDFDWSKFDLVFDLGDAKGDHLPYILQCENELNICIFDKPAAIKSAQKKWLSDQPLSSAIRVSFEEGDILYSMPKATTNEHLYCFVGVFRQLIDQNCLLVLNNIRKAIGAFDSTVVIFDLVLPETKADRLMTLSDMQLLAEKSGKERTLSQWSLIFAQSDFELVEMVTLRSANCALVLMPK